MVRNGKQERKADGEKKLSQQLCATAISSHDYRRHRGKNKINNSNKKRINIASSTEGMPKFGACK